MCCNKDKVTNDYSSILYIQVLFQNNQQDSGPLPHEQYPLLNVITFRNYTNASDLCKDIMHSMQRDDIDKVEPFKSTI